MKLSVVTAILGLIALSLAAPIADSMPPRGHAIKRVKIEDEPLYYKPAKFFKRSEIPTTVDFEQDSAFFSATEQPIDSDAAVAETSNFPAENEEQFEFVKSVVQDKGVNQTDTEETLDVFQPAVLITLQETEDEQQENTEEQKPSGPAILFAPPEFDETPANEETTNQEPSVPEVNLNSVISKSVISAIQSTEQDDKGDNDEETDKNIIKQFPDLDEDDYQEPQDDPEEPDEQPQPDEGNDDSEDDESPDQSDDDSDDEGDSPQDPDEYWHERWEKECEQDPDCDFEEYIDKEHIDELHSQQEPIPAPEEPPVVAEQAEKEM